jgi:hypothetical protein
VVEQHYGFTRTGAAQPRDYIAASRRRLDDPSFYSFPVKDLLEESRRFDLVARRVGGIDLNVTAEK